MVALFGVLSSTCRNWFGVRSLTNAPAHALFRAAAKVAFPKNFVASFQQFYRFWVTTFWPEISDNHAGGIHDARLPDTQMQ